VSASVIVVDLDHFKRINDQRGHHVGDRVLRKMGEILRSCTRNTDGLGRWGGEEFVLVCPGASLAKAADLAEKLRQKIMETNFIPRIRCRSRRASAWLPRVTTRVRRRIPAGGPGAVSGQESRSQLRGRRERRPDAPDHRRAQRHLGAGQRALQAAQVTSMDTEIHRER
jgi:GGDEF domain-containing protein